MTDIIEDAEIILERAIDLLDIFLNRLIERLNQNRHRPLNRRTLLRWIAAFFPIPVNPRIKIKKDLASESHMLSRWASCGSLPSGESVSSLNELVEEQLGDNIVRYRIAGNECPEQEDDVFEETTPFMESFDWNCVTSTPNLNASSCSSVASSRDPEAQSKISEMEEELVSLRKQIAMLVMAQENTTLSKTVVESNSKETDISQVAAVPLPESPTNSRSPDDSGCEINRPPSCCSDEMSDAVFALPPPPPPPPPPPLPPQLKSQIGGNPTSTLDTSSLLARRKNLSKAMGNTNSDTSSKEVPKMSDVLRDLSSVKLKTVERSPGGTPFRNKPRYDPTDPASIIAQALRKKFAHHHGLFSPDSDKENDGSFQSPDQITPKNSRNPKRRLSLLASDSSDSWTPVARSPLQTLTAL